MSKYFIFCAVSLLALMSLALLFGCQRNELSPAVKTVNKAIGRNVKTLSRQYPLIPFGVGISMPEGEVQWLELKFEILGPLTKAELRKILVETAQDFFADLESDALLCTYLKCPPLNIKNIDITLFIIDANRISTYYPNISVARISEGKLAYKIWLNDQWHTIQSQETETYEEALQALCESKETQNRYLSQQLATSTSLATNPLQFVRQEYVASGRASTWINGIRNKRADIDNTAQQISRAGGGIRVDYVAIPTRGFFRDSIEYLVNRFGHATDGQSLLGQLWNRIQKDDLSTKILHYAHNRGVAQTKNELELYDPVKRQNIRVAAFCPAAYINPETCGSVVHYRNQSWWRDPVPRLDPLGARKDKDTIVNLASHPAAGCSDDGILSPTYEKPMVEEMQKFLASG